jgi:5'-3' exonuclease
MDTPVSETRENVCLIDGDSLIYYEMGSSTLEMAISGFNSRVETILHACSTTKYVGFLTSTEKFRTKVATSYKANRVHKPKPPIFYALQKHAEQFWRFKYFDGLEADDLVAYYKYSSGVDPTKAIICSPDKDVLYQCSGEHYNYRTMEIVKTTPEEAVRFLWKQVLMGDATDCIGGLPGIGDKTSENWLAGRTKEFETFALKKYVEKFGVVDGLFEFHKTFRLVYLLRTPTDILREVGYALPPISDLINQTPDSNESDESWSESPW